MALRSLAWWACLAAAGALRQLPLSGNALGCGRIVSRSPKSAGQNLTFPLDVEGLLERSDHNKSLFFAYLKEAGIDRKLKPTVPSSVGRECLGNGSYVIFMGDCMVHQAYDAYKRLPWSAKSILSRTPELFMHAAGAEDMQSADGEAWEYLPSGSWLVEDKPSRSIYVRSHAYNHTRLQQDLRDTVARVRPGQPAGARLLIWMDTLLYSFMGGDRSWIDPEQRKERQRELVEFIREEFPFAEIVWDSPTFVDVPLMKAWPVHREAANFEENDVLGVTAGLARQDLEYMPSLGVPVTLRWEISNTYRGLQCDGIHATGAFMRWGCENFPAYEEMNLQSGLYQVCTKKKPAPLCKARRDKIRA